MKTTKSEKTITSRRKREKMPLPIRSGVPIVLRVNRARLQVRSLLQGPWSRNDFKNHIEGVLSEAASTFCQFLYAAANGKHVQAGEWREEVKLIVEYELAMELLHPTKQLKRCRSRRKAVEEVLTIIEAEMALCKKRVEEQYAMWGRKAIKASPIWKDYHLNKPLTRPAESRFQEFFPWIKEVVWETFSMEEILASRAKHRSRDRVPPYIWRG